MAQSVERILGKDEVTGSIPVSSSKNPVCKSERGFYLLPIASSLLLQAAFGTLRSMMSRSTGDAFADFAEQKNKIHFPADAHIKNV